MPGQSGAFISYSINNEDVLLNRLFGARQTGFYVDVGAAHPTFESDTKLLYDRGWSGINIEPNRSFFDALVAGRPRDRNLNVAVSDEPGELLFFEVVGTGLSTCDPQDAARARARGFEVIERLVKTETLRDILDAAQPGAIDFMKIDVEGFEPNVVRSNDWNRFRPLLVLAEATFPGTPTRRPDAIGPLLRQAGYRHVYFDGLNDYYAERDFTPPEGAFATPPNVFDQFTPFAQAELARKAEAQRAEIESLRQDGQAARDALEAAEAAREADLKRAGDEISVLLGRIQATEAARAEARAQAAAMRQSTSWRVTAPLRALRRVLGKRAG